jgi:hypothetical protein
MRLKSSRQAQPTLCVETVAILLAGWSAVPPRDVPSAPDGVSDAFLRLYAIGRTAALWRVHSRSLRARAAEWGWEPKHTHNGQRLFYGEYVANGGEEL